jgi:hypothetical protein
MTNVIQFPHPHSPVQPIAHFIRLGETGYQKLASLHAAGRFPAQRIVVDASRLNHQKEFVAALRASGAEIVLDTKAAELSALQKFAGYARHAPWAAAGNGTPLRAGHFEPTAAHDIFGQIARFAVEHGVDGVLAPAHFLGDRTFDNWFETDRKSCLALRRSLDREGGGAIVIHYPLILPHLVLNDGARRSSYLSGLDGLPYECLWIRASGFGHDAAPLTTRRFIEAMLALHNLGKPVIADCLGGLVGQAALAFGAVSGIAHGIGERERFDARDWHELPKKSEDGKGGGRIVRILISGLDRSATRNELEVMARARGGRKLVACGDRHCCPHGLEDMLNDPRQHAAYQSFAMIKGLAEVPDSNREQHFLSGRMMEVDRVARQMKELRFSADEARAYGVDPEKLTKRLSKHSKQMDKMRLCLEDLHESRGESAPRSRPVAPRVANHPQRKSEMK